MDVPRTQFNGRLELNGSQAGRGSRMPAPGTLGAERIGQILGEWQAREVRVVSRFAECRGLSVEQLQDLYQETALALLARPYGSEEHLRNALHTGIKQRALRLHRDERRRSEILAQHAPSLQRQAQLRARSHAPENAALRRADRLIVTEFLAALDHSEQRVFALLAENMQYRAIAGVLEIPVNEARRTVRACERKRVRFQLLYDTGRLCGYRAVTIEALQSGAGASEALAAGALAHLASCAACRAQHKTNARRLADAFRGQAAALLPGGPLLASQLGRLSRTLLRARLSFERFLPGGGMPSSGGGVTREGAVAILASGGAAAKIAAGIATVAVIAGSTVGVRSALEHRATHPRRHHAHTIHTDSAGASAVQRLPATTAETNISSQRHEHSETAHTLAHDSQTERNGAPAQHEPGGFAYLGVPTGRARPNSDGQSAHAASANTATPETHSQPAQEEQQTGGGPFSP